MKDPRISVRISQDEHEQLKVLVAKRRTNINQFLTDYIRNEIKKGELNRTKSKIEGAKVLSLFANIGVAEAFFEDIGIDVVLANEIVERRAKLYQEIYPKTEMKIGDITSTAIQEYLIARSNELGVNVIMATPPCQGMSTAGRQEKDDERNDLIVPVVKLIKEISPKYAFIENVPLLFQTSINYKDEEINIIEFIQKELGRKYRVNTYKIDTKDYGVPQTRERAIILLSRSDVPYEWVVPPKEDKIVTMRDAIGNLPPLDPHIKDISHDELIKLFPNYEERAKAAHKISKWHFPPTHVRRQVEVMMHTATGKTAFDNKPEYKPQKDNGEFVKGFKNTYKRQEWDIPAYTVTMDNRKISSQNNVHPGRPIGTTQSGAIIYSDARALTVYELMLVSSIPNEWPLPENTPAAFLRSVIGEGIPPLFTRRVFEQLRGAIWE
ncbi:MAG: DNA cytosine methyltransferase [Firmicutes bacterium]|nr:DNA cytosine methyltransferase [Bacillota bacterium]